MILSSTVRKGTRRLVAAGLAAVATITVATAATPGFPFVEDFTTQEYIGAGTSSATADWDVSGLGSLSLPSEAALTSMSADRFTLGDVLEGDPNTATSSRDIALGDFDGDGLLDAVVANTGSGNTGPRNEIFFNNGGAFDTAPVALGNDQLATWGIAVGDIDNDGALDIVAGNFQGPPLYYLNDGFGGFANGVEISDRAANTWRIVLVDVDADSDLDVIEAVDGDSNFLYLNQLIENGGELSFSDEIRVTAADQFKTRAIAIGDLNNDGDQDIVAGDYGSPNQIYAWFEGQFVPGGAVDSSSNTTFAVALADLNGDGWLDLVEGNNSGTPTRIYPNSAQPGSPSFDAPLSLAGSIADHVTVSLLLRDFDRDGDIDIVEGNNGFWDADRDGDSDDPQPVRLFLNDGDGTFSFSTVIELDTTSAQKIYGSAAGDINDDGQLDFVTAHSKINGNFPDVLSANAVYINRGTPGATQFQQLDGYADSSNVNVVNPAPSGDLSAAVLTVDKTTPAELAHLQFYLSNNGSRFIPVTPGVPVSFPDANANELYWKVEMLTASPDSSQLPVIEQINIDPNRAPNFTDVGDITLVEGANINPGTSLSAYFSDPDNHALTYQLSGLPSGTGIVLDPSTGNLTGVPTSADAVASPISVRAFGYDGADSDDGTIQIFVQATTNAVPTANDDGPYEVNEGGSITGAFNVLGNDTDPENDPLTAVLENPPSASTLFELRPDGTFDYTHNGSEAATDSFTYRAEDSEGGLSNVATVTISIIPVNDQPVITLNGDATVNVQVGATFTDPGATASDAEDGDLTDDIVVGGDTVDTSTAGTYIITYNVTDSGGLEADEVTRTVTVTEDANNPPTIELLGDATINLTVGDSFTDPGATASDPEDGDLTADIVVGGDTVNTSAAGTYVITYNVTDSDGNAAPEVTRTVRVTAETTPPPSGGGGAGGGGAVELWQVLALMLLAAGAIMHRRRRPVTVR